MALLRAAGAASGLPPDLAVVAFGPEAVSVASASALAAIMRHGKASPLPLTDAPPGGQRALARDEAALLQAYVKAMLRRAERRALAREALSRLAASAAAQAQAGPCSPRPQAEAAAHVAPPRVSADAGVDAVPGYAAPASAAADLRDSPAI